MTVTAPAVRAPAASRQSLREAVRTTFFLGVREIRTVLRTPAAFWPGLFIPLFFFFVMVGSLDRFAAGSGIENYRAFQLPVSILFAVANAGAGLNMVADIESGYFDKLLLTPIHRMSLLVGAMSADFLRILFQGAFVITVAMATGTEFATGIAGAVSLAFFAALFGIGLSALGFGIALKTGNSQATQSTWVIFMPMMFLTTTFAPKEALTGWLRTASAYDPITYALRGMRALTMTGWDLGEIGVGLIAVGILGTLTFTFAFRALLGRVR